MSAETRPQPALLVQPFPMPGRRLALAYRELDITAEGTAEQRKALGDLGRLPRPWDPASCKTTALRTELWEWLESVVTWLNHEYVFDPADMIPACWPRHPHLVHEFAVLADQRRRAGYAFTSDAMEEWHRYGLPAFLERMRYRVADHCTEAHPAAWPSTGRFTRHLADQTVAARQDAFSGDVAAVQQARHVGSTNDAPPRLQVVDETPGEILD